MHDFYLFIRPDDQVPGISEPVLKKGHVAWKPGIIFLIPEFFTLCEVYGYLSKFHLVCGWKEWRCRPNVEFKVATITI